MYEPKNVGINYQETVQDDRDIFEVEEYPRVAGWHRPLLTSSKSKLSGWQKGILFGIVAVTVVLVANISFAVWVGLGPKYDNGTGTIYEGDCVTTSRLDLGIHLAINLFSTLLLGASNYCMQVLSSPTRADVDKAHAKKRWLDIGLLSVRNLRYISRDRSILWFFIGLLSLPLHLIYNSVVHSSMTAYNYDWLAVSPEFLTGAPFHNSFYNYTFGSNGNPPSFAHLQNIQENLSNFQNLTNKECISVYAQSLVNDRSDVVLVTSLSNKTNSIYVSEHAYKDGQGEEAGFFETQGEWICEAADTDSCNVASLVLPGPDDFYAPGMTNVKVDYCLSRPMPNICKLSASLPLIIVVMCMNFGKLLCIALALVFCKERPLVTLGDSIASFIENPDLTTRKRSLYGRSGFQINWTKEAEPIIYHAKNHRWWSPVSRKRWWLSLMACSVALMAVGILLDQAIIALGFGTPSASTIVALGFGSINTNAYLSNSPTNIYANIILANTPQLIFSLLYLAYNSLYTGMLTGSEWASYETKRRPLRVSHPKGQQSSSYRLQLPYAYGFPLMFASAMMHWIISQSFFLLDLNFTGPYAIDTATEVTCGYSVFPIIIGLALAGCMLLVLLITGSRSRKSGMPIVGSCSAAISAACQSNASGLDILLPLKWGATIDVDRSEAKRCAFSSDEVGETVEGEAYF